MFVLVDKSLPLARLKHPRIDECAFVCHMLQSSRLGGVVSSFMMGGTGMTGPFNTVPVLRKYLYSRSPLHVSGLPFVEVKVADECGLDGCINELPMRCGVVMVHGSLESGRSFSNFRIHQLMHFLVDSVLMAFSVLLFVSSSILSRIDC